jgi:hypothetical protein
MDMKEAAAMTEASGLIQDEGSRTETSGRTPGSGTREAPRESSSARLPSSNQPLRWADQLREITVKAPLTSLLVAFLIGRWIARRG